MARNRSNIKTAASRSGMAISLHITVEGVDRTDDEFKRIRRVINGRLRDAIQQVGEREALPAAKRAFGVVSRTFADALYVQRDRSGVFIGVRLRGSLNRAAGWLDFGGRRPRDHHRRQGPYTIVNALDRTRPKVDAALLDALTAEFGREFEVS